MTFFNPCMKSANLITHTNGLQPGKKNQLTFFKIYLIFRLLSDKLDRGMRIDCLLSHHYISGLREQKAPGTAMYCAREKHRVHDLGSLAMYIQYHIPPSRKIFHRKIFLCQNPCTSFSWLATDPVCKYFTAAWAWLCKSGFTLYFFLYSTDNSIGCTHQFLLRH